MSCRHISCYTGECCVCQVAVSSDLGGILNVPDGVRCHGGPAGCVALLSKAAPAVVLTVGLHRDAHRVGHQRLGTALDVDQASIGITRAAYTADTAKWCPASGAWKAGNHAAKVRDCTQPAVVAVHIA